MALRALQRFGQRLSDGPNGLAGSLDTADLSAKAQQLFGRRIDPRRIASREQLQRKCLVLKILPAGQAGIPVDRGGHDVVHRAQPWTLVRAVDDAVEIGGQQALGLDDF